MNDELKNRLHSILGSEIIRSSAISGGDISKAYVVYTKSDRFFCKYHLGGNSLDMFIAEKDGLEAISATNAIYAPHVIAVEPSTKGAFLLLEYIESKSPSAKEMELLGCQLAEMHQITSGDFGWPTDNFIGSLPQSNTRNENWPHFYAEERILPQLNRAVEQKMLSLEEVPSGEKLVKGIHAYCDPENPSLIHGDLWGGNFLISATGQPCLIDPSVSFADPHMDIAMSRLFGGFNASFYLGYSEVANATLPNEAQTDLYQLYYLLVHLNLFGRSYYPSVRRILRTYFSKGVL